MKLKICTVLSKGINLLSDELIVFPIKTFCGACAYSQKWLFDVMYV